jgi:hypothetical protein
LETNELLIKRFTKAIGKSFAQVPLIGPRWFKWYGSAKPPYFQFIGVRKLAKATATTPDEVVRRILKHLNMKGVDAEVQVTADAKINLRLKSEGKDK